MNELHRQDMPFFRDGLGYKEANPATQALIIKEDLQAAVC